MPRRQIAAGAAGALPGRFGGATLRLCLPNRRRGLIDLDPHLRTLERADLVRSLQHHAVHEALREAATWPADFTVAVDLLPLAAANGAALDAALDALAATGLPPQRLVLQIDEAELIAGGLGLRNAVVAIGAAGIGLALRGFGETFGAFGLPRDLPISALILDRSMLRAECGETGLGPPAAPLARTNEAKSGTKADAPDTGIDADVIIARAAAALGRGTGLAVIADGIETASDFTRAAAHGVDFAQGPWIGAPMAPGAFAASIAG